VFWFDQKTKQTKPNKKRGSNGRTTPKKKGEKPLRPKKGETVLLFFWPSALLFKRSPSVFSFFVQLTVSCQNQKQNKQEKMASPNKEEKKEKEKHGAPGGMELTRPSASSGNTTYYQPDPPSSSAADYYKLTRPSTSSSSSSSSSSSTFASFQHNHAPLETPDDYYSANYYKPPPPAPKSVTFGSALPADAHPVNANTNIANIPYGRWNPPVAVSEFEPVPGVFYLFRSEITNGQWFCGQAAYKDMLGTNFAIYSAQGNLTSSVDSVLKSRYNHDIQKQHFQSAEKALQALEFLRGKK
jgi:hypothetical protein